MRKPRIQKHLILYARKFWKNIILENPCITAIGECGLDYSDGFPDKSIQLPCFEEQLKLSCELKMPLYIHNRGAFDDFVDLMDKYHDRLNDVKILIHCFTGSKEFAFKLLDLGAYISASGVVTFKKSYAFYNEIEIHN